MEKLLEVKDLKVSFFTDLGETQAVKDAGFAIEEGDFRWYAPACNDRHGHEQQSESSYCR